MTPVDGLFEFKVKGLCLTIKYRNVREYTAHVGRKSPDIRSKIPHGIESKIRVAIGSHINKLRQKVSSP